MLAGVGPVWQALLGTLFTWGLTAAGSALVFVFHGGQVSPVVHGLGLCGSWTFCITIIMGPEL